MRIQKANLNLGSHREILQNLIYAHPRGVLMVTSLLLLIFTQTTNSTHRPVVEWMPAALSVLSIILFLFGFQSKELPDDLRAFFTGPSRFFSITPTQSIYLLFSILFSVLAAMSNTLGGFQESIWLTIMIWLISIFLVFLGLWDPGGLTIPTRRTLLSAAVLGFTGFLVRFISVTTIPVALTGDEASMGLSALSFIEGVSNNIFAVGWFSFPSFFYFIESLSIRIFGNTTVALRFPSAIAGGLTVSCVYIIGRTLFNRQTGWLAAIFLIGFHFHIHFSRLGLNNIWDGLSIVIILGSFWYGWQKDRRIYFVIAGFWLGLAQYFYVSSKIVPVLIPAWAGLAFFWDREKFKKHIGNLAALFITAVVVVSPLAWFYIQNPSEFMAPIERVRLTPEWLASKAAENAITEWQVIADQVWIGLKAFAYEPLRAWYAPGTPLLRPAPAALFLIGLALLLVRSKDLRTWLVFLVLLGFGMVSGLSFDPPAAQRYVAVAPWLALVCGFAIAETTVRLKDLWPNLGRGLVVGSFLLAAYLAFDDARFYFFEYTPPTTEWTDNNAVAQHLADYLRTRPDIEEVYFLGMPRMGYYSIQSTNFLVPDVNGVDVNEDWGSPNNPEVKSNEPVFVLLPHKEEDLKAIMADYPGGDLLEARTPEGELIYWMYETTKTK